MAMLNIDLSEYDMMRESKKKLEEEIYNLKKINEELKKDIKGLENNSRVIIKTKYNSIDCNKAASMICACLSMDNSYCGFNTAPRLREILIKVFQNLEERNPESTYYVNFADIEENVRKHFNDKILEKYELLVNDLKETREHLDKEYQNKLNKAVEAVKVDKDNIIFEKDLEIENKIKEIKSYRKQIKKLTIDNNELSKTLEEKQKEALEELNKAKDKYNKLINKKGFFKRLFNIN